MTNQHTKQNIISSLFWKLLERGGTQGVQFIIQILLARLLTPEEYGVIAILNVFILIGNVFVQSGLNTALVQKKNVDEVDFSSVFYLSLIIAGISYVILFFTAPYIANYYRNIELIPLLRVLAVILFFGAINSIQNSIIARNMMFRKLFTSSLWAVLISGIVGLILANFGFGVWALVAQQIVNHFLIMVILWFQINWRPKFLFSIQRVKLLFSFGWKILASSLLNTFYMNLRTLIIGRSFSSQALGYYNRGQQFPQVIVENINGSIQAVLLPVLASQQDDIKKIKDMVRRSVMTSSFIIFPLMVGLAVISEPLVSIILTDKWLPAVPFLQVYCGVYALKPIYNANLQAINALGRSDIFLRLEVFSTIIGIISLVISIPFGPFAIASGALLSGIISLFIYMTPNIKLINYSLSEQIKDITPSFLLSLIMGSLVYLISFINLDEKFLLIIQIIVGGLVYLTTSKLFRINSFEYLLSTLKALKKNI